MRLVVALLFSMFQLSCRPPSPQFNPTNNDNINQVVKAIINDEGNYFKDSLPLSIDLKKMTVANLPLDSTQRVGAIPIEWILNKDHAEQFNPKDSLYILSQNNKVKSFRLDKSFFSNITLTTADAQETLKPPRFYEISIPIFSADNKKAYVQMNKHCEMCGKGYTFYLEKRNKEWKIIWWTLRWIS
jgi:hypothetical protein